MLSTGLKGFDEAIDGLRKSDNVVCRKEGIIFNEDWFKPLKK